MTNGPATPTENGPASDAALIAAITTDTINTIDTAAEPAVAAAPVPEKAPSFDDLPLHPDVKQALDDMGYFAPTAVQTAVFHPVTEGKDLLVQSRTGTGKTTAFGLPLINRIVPAVRQPQAMILCPTRELALQVARELTQLAKHRGVVIEAVYGGAPIGKQISALRDGVHIIVGTPGRVLDHIGRRTLDCKTISTFVLDECDEMLSMGFLEDIERVTSNLPEKHQTLLFSATMPVEVERYAKRHMKSAENLSLSRDSTTVTDIHHAYYIVSGIARSRDLLKILYAEKPDSAIIFCNMRDETTMVAKFLTKQGLDAEPLSSDLSQADRERVMGRMKAKNLRFLCATDVAARGIDISNLSHVINFSVPESPEVYVHRTGRTGRAGKKGVALSLVGPRELGNFRFIRLQFGIKPEERLLPKDDIFVGTPAASLPPIGRQVAPDPVDLLIRAVPQTPGDLEIGILEKLLKKASGKRVLAQLVAEKLNAMSSRSSNPRRDERPPSDERRFDGGERPERGGGRDRDRGPRPGGDRPRFDRDRGPGPGGDQVITEGHERPGGRDDRPRYDRDRPRFDRDRGGPGADGGRGPGSSEGGEFVAPGGPGGVIPEGEQRPREDRPRFDRDRGGDRGDRPRFDRGDRPRFDRDDRGPREDRGPRDDRPRLNADGTPAPHGANGTNGESRGDRGDRPRFDRGDRPRFDRDRGPRDRDNRNDNRGENRNDTIPVVDTTATEVTATSTEQAPVSTEAAAPTEQRSDRDRDRGDRGGRDRDRGGRDRDRGERRFDRDRNDRPAQAQAPAPEQRDSHPEMAASPALAETLTDTDATATKVDDVAKAALERGSKSRDKKRSEPIESREFWETWADNKSTKPDVAAKPAAAAAPVAEATDEVAAEEGDTGEERKGRSRGGRGRGRGGKAAAAKADDKPAAKASAKEAKEPKAEAKKDEAPSRAKRDTVVTPAADGTQARLFVSLGKKHGVSADDLRSLLAGPIGGDTARIGSVSLRDAHAHVRVPEELVEKIISGVHGTQHKDQDVTVERSRA